MLQDEPKVRALGWGGVGELLGTGKPVSKEAGVTQCCHFTSTDGDWDQSRVLTGSVLWYPLMGKKNLRGNGKSPRCVTFVNYGVVSNSHIPYSKVGTRQPRASGYLRSSKSRYRSWKWNISDLGVSGLLPCFFFFFIMSYNSSTFLSSSFIIPDPYPHQPFFFPFSTLHHLLCHLLFVLPHPVAILIK